MVENMTWPVDSERLYMVKTTDRSVHGNVWGRCRDSSVLPVLRWAEKSGSSWLISSLLVLNPLLRGW